MKNILVLALVLQTAGFAAAALAHSLGYLAFDVLTPAGVTGALLLAAVLAFAWADYRRKPSFRVRRTREGHSSTTAFRSTLPPPDWTYQTRSK